MSQDNVLREAFASVEVNADFTEATVGLSDGSRLRFCHRVGERWARADPPQGVAALVLETLSRFRLNGKHLELHFADGSRWEARFR